MSTRIVEALLGKVFTPRWTTHGWKADDQVTFLPASEIPSRTPRWWITSMRDSSVLDKTVDPDDRAAIFAAAVNVWGNGGNLSVMAVSVLHTHSGDTHMGLVRIDALPLDHPIRVAATALSAAQQIDAFTQLQRNEAAPPDAKFDKAAASAAWSAAVRAGVAAKAATK